MKKYKNPILLCDYSDPDVIRVGDTFYLTASSFNFVPGLPLLESKNLVDWKLVGYAAKKVALSGYDEVQNAKGIWAPSLRFHGGLFYIFFATPDEGIFETHARDFRGEWSEWNCVWSGKGFIDPCPLWDDDGKIYVVHGYAKSRIGFNSKLGILELDENLKAKTEDRIIFDGTKSQPTIEGPKIYKRGGFYYIFAPAGGVANGWQTVLRSENIFGGYEEKIVLAQGKTKINGPHQGGYVETQDGSGYFMHFQDAGIFGRITHLQPVKWRNGWPLMGSAAVQNCKVLNCKVQNHKDENFDENETVGGIGEPLEEYFVPYDDEKTETAENADTARVNSCGFEVEKGIPEFQFSGNAGLESLETENGDFSKKFYGDGTLWLNPNVCTKKIDAESFVYEKKIEILRDDGLLRSARNDVEGEKNRLLRFARNDEKNIEASDFTCKDVGMESRCVRHGIIFLGNEYSALEVEKRADGFYLVQIVSSGSEKGDETRKESVVFEAKLSKSVNSVVLNMKFAGEGRLGKVIFSCEADGENGKIDFVSGPFRTENAHWVGGRYGWF